MHHAAALTCRGWWGYCLAICDAVVAPCAPARPRPRVLPCRNAHGLYGKLPETSSSLDVHGCRGSTDLILRPNVRPTFAPWRFQRRLLTDVGEGRRFHWGIFVEGQIFFSHLPHAFFCSHILFLLSAPPLTDANSFQLISNLTFFQDG